MKVLHLIWSLSPAGGGPPEAVKQLITAYHIAGHSVEVACADLPGEAYLNLSCPVHALGPSSWGKYTYAPKLADWLDQNVARFDAVIVNGIWTYLGIAAARACKKHNRPYGIFVHGALDPWFKKRYPLKHLKKCFYWPFQYANLRDAKAVFFTTETERILARESFKPNKWNEVVVPYGIGDPVASETPEHEAQQQIAQFRQSVPGLGDSPYLVYLSRIHEKKGCDLLVSAFAAISREHPDLHLVMVGPGDAHLLHKLQDSVQTHGLGERVHWPGTLRGALKWGALRGSEAFVLPSHQENFGIAVVEALAVGCAVLISNQVNIWDEIEADAVGLVDSDTVEGAERLLRHWFALSIQDRAAMRGRARQSFLKRYAIDMTVRAINHHVK